MFQAQRARMLLIGDSAVTAHGLATKSQEHLPEFVPLDLLHSYVLGERKRIYKSTELLVYLMILTVNKDDHDIVLNVKCY